MNYFNSLQQTMKWLGEQENSFFVGQTVGCPGTFMYPTLRDVPIEKRLEFPVNESLQLQFSIGLALTGYSVISVYPRQNFLLLAVGDLVNTLDKIPAISQGKINPHVMIRVAEGPSAPVNPGHQHLGDYTEAFKLMFKKIKVYDLKEPEDIFPAYEQAYNEKVPSLLIEHGNFYGSK